MPTHARQRRTLLRGLPALALPGLLVAPGAARAGEGAGAGWLLLSLGTGADRPFRSCALSLRALGGGARAHTLRYPAAPGWTGKSWPYRTAQGQGEVLLLTLPAGDYEIHDFELVQQTGQAQRVERAQVPLRIPVRIRDGQLSYLGNFEAHAQRRVVLVVSDRLEADLRLVQAADGPALAGMGVPVRALPDLAARPHPQLQPHLEAR